MNFMIFKRKKHCSKEIVESHKQLPRPIGSKVGVIRFKPKYNCNEFEIGTIVGYRFDHVRYFFVYAVEFDDGKSEAIKESELFYSYIKRVQENENHEESEGYWFINAIGEVGFHTRKNGMTDSENLYIEDCQLEIGNYFKTKEEADKAVEKLKAWKRLKDKGFRFDGDYCIAGVEKDFDLLFGGDVEDTNVTKKEK